MDARFSPSLTRIVGRLDQLTEHTSSTLASALDSPLSLDDVVDFVRLDRHNYRRNLILRRPEYEVRLLCWMPGQRTSLHGHDGSACAFRILSGTSTEIRLGQPDNRWSPGQVIAEQGTNFVHQVTNLATDPLISLHAYAPALPIDQPPASYEGRHVVIVGGGVSGAALAIHLLRGSTRDLKITLVERRQWLGRGPAYGTTDPAFRLNVPAERMSLSSQAPNDFVAWATERGEEVPTGALLPRRLFGEYVEDRLGEAIADSQGKVWFHRTAAVSAAKEGVLLADGAFLKADAVVLATGNQLPAAPDALSEELLRSPRVIGDPWSDGALTAIGREEEVLLVGTGLTAVDVLLSLRNQGHRGRIVAISRRGLLPRAHLDPEDPRRSPVTLDATTLPRNVRLLCHFLRDEVARLEREGVAWQCLIDALRPHTAALWNALPLVERARFMRRLRPYWEVVRHRAAADALTSLERWRTAGKVEILAGAIAAAEPQGESIALRLRLREKGTVDRRCDRIVLCTGPETDVRRFRGLLFRSLLSERQIAPDPLGLGILTHEDGRVIDGDGHASDWLYTIGALRRAHLWESTAVPDLIRQAEALAQRLRGAS